jgi:hypothetical protein
MTFAAIWTFVKSPVGRYAVAAIALAGILWAAAAHFRHQGQLEGKQEATDTLTQQMQKQHEADRQDTNNLLQQFDQRFQGYEAKLDAAAQREEQQAKIIADLVAQRKQASDKVDGLKDNELHDFITATIALREKTDKAAGYTPGEERVIAHAVVDDPLCRKESQTFPAQLQACKDGQTQLTGERDVNLGKFNALADYTGRLEGYYVEAYNAIPRKGNFWLRVISLGVAGKPKKIAVPDLKALKGEAQSSPKPTTTN